MRLRLVSLAATAAVAAAVLPAHAGTAKPQITDPTGDANGVNGQPELIGGPDPNVATGPASYASADIVSVSFVNNFATKKVKRKTVKAPVSFTVTLTLAAAPDARTYYGVTANVPGCSQGVTFEYSTQPIYGADDVNCFDGSTFNDYPAMSAVIKGNSISWTVPVAGIPVGTKLTGLAAHAGEGVLGAMPTLDEAETTATFTVGR